MNRFSIISQFLCFCQFIQNKLCEKRRRGGYNVLGAAAAGSVNIPVAVVHEGTERMMGIRDGFGGRSGMVCGGWCRKSSEKAVPLLQTS